MAQSQYSLTWAEYKRNLCNGLSSLQQNGEFVDMTLAADGHFVKVHQVVLALISPFIKDLIKSADCPHPVIFLNKISYPILCSILEYIYTGEVLVSVDNLDEFIEAGRQLHIRGLDEMKSYNNFGSQQSYQTECVTMEDLNEDIYFEVTDQKNNQVQSQLNFDDTLNSKPVNVEMEDTCTDKTIDEDNYDIISLDHQNDSITDKKQIIDPKNVKVMQYTVSNQGSLQMILNRFLYYMKHTNRNNSRQWRCVDYLGPLKCPAYVVTKDDFVVQRISSHTHPFHDKKILKKVQSGAIFTAIQEAVKEGCTKKVKTESRDKQIDTE